MELMKNEKLIGKLIRSAKRIKIIKSHIHMLPKLINFDLFYYYF